MNKMRVTFVDEKLNMDGGGSNFSLDLMARMLSKRGHNITILTLDSSKNNLPSDSPYNVVSLQSNFGSRLGRLEHAYRAMSEYKSKTDLFHVFSPLLLPAAGYFCKQNESIPVVGQLLTYSMFCVNMDRMDGSCHRNCTARAKFAHQDASIKKRIAKIPFYISRTFIEPSFAANLDTYFAISPVVKNIYTDVGIPAGRVSVIPDFYDPRFGKEAPTSTNSCDSFQILYVGRVEPMKGLSCLINALTQTSQIELTIVGEGSAVPDVTSLTDANSLSDRISFEGWVPHDDLASYYANADLFIHPAILPEPFGRTLLESMQMNTPALVSDIGGPPWVVDRAGLTFPPNKPEHLSRILTYIQRNPDILSELEKNCSDRLEDFKPQLIISSIEEKYDSLTNCSVE